MREHNFKLCTWRVENNPMRELWECTQCDTQVSFLKGMNRGAVNRFMANRHACLDPIGGPVDVNDIDTSRTTVVKKPKPKILRLNK